MITRVSHIGVVVRSIDDSLELMEELFGARELERLSFPEAAQTSSLVQVGDTLFELMEPLGQEGVVAKYLYEHGEGLHHVSLYSNDLDGDCEVFQRRGVRIVGKAESGDMKVAFTHPKSTFGVLFEITAEN